MTNRLTIVTSNPFAVQLGYLHGVLTSQTGDLTAGESLFQPPNGGNCINWIVGHIMESRHQMLELVGKPPVWQQGEGARYARGSQPITGPEAGVLELSRLLADYRASQAPILEGLEAMSEEALAIKVPWFGGEIDKAGAMAGLLFHEAYHVGQAGMIRRLLGKASALGA
jgi:hypothetical protein